MVDEKLDVNEAARLLVEESIGKDTVEADGRAMLDLAHGDEHRLESCMHGGSNFRDTPLPPPAPTEGPRLLGSPLVGVSTGLSGDAVPAAILAFDLRVFGPLSIALGFAWMPSQDFALAPGHVEVQLLHGQLAGCLSSWRVLGRARLGACLQLDVGAIRGKGVGYDTTGEVTRPWTALGLLGLLDVPVAGPFYWSSRLSALVVTQQEGFRIDRVGVAFDPAPVGLLVATGVGVRFF